MLDKTKKKALAIIFDELDGILDSVVFAERHFSWCANQLARTDLTVGERGHWVTSLDYARDARDEHLADLKGALGFLARDAESVESGSGDQAVRLPSRNRRRAAPGRKRKGRGLGPSAQFELLPAQG